MESGCNGPVNIASGVGVRIADVVTKIGSIVGRPELIRLGELPSPANEPATMAADVGRLTKEVGFTPGYTLDSALEKTVEWWRGNQ